MDYRFYDKKYEMMTNGSLLLTNPEPALHYIETMVGKLLVAQSSDEEREVKLEILRDFKKIYEYDLEHAYRPEPCGHFDSLEEKKKFATKKMLNQDFSLYLANIFSNFHEQRYKRDNNLPVLRCPIMVVDYNELYDRALCDYITTLTDMPYPFKINERGQVLYADISTQTKETKSKESFILKEVEYRGIVRRVPVPVDNQIPRPEKSQHAVCASYILPSLIEHFLGMYLQNRMLFSGLKQLMQIMQNSEIEMDMEERSIIDAFTGQQREQIIFNGSQKYIMGKVYALFVRTEVLSDTEDNQMLFTGNGRRRRNTLTSMLYTDYAKSQICPEYMELLLNMFESKKMNIRNSIMHGSSETMDYLAIGIASVMIQILWDIASEHIFVCTREELLHDSTKKETII
jgi:hypothetical protein